VAGGNLVVFIVNGAVHKVIFAMIAQSWKSVIKISDSCRPGKPRNLAIFTCKLLKNSV